MLAKSICTELVNELCPQLMDSLELKQEDVTVVVLHSKSKFVAELKAPTDCMALCKRSKDENNCVIIIYYDKHYAPLEFCCSLFHELLHARFNKFYLINEDIRGVEKEEEKFVQQLESIFKQMLEVIRGKNK